MRHIAIVLVLALTCIAADAPAPSGSAVVIEAKRKYDLRIKAARVAYYTELAKDDQQYISDLGDGLKAAMDAGPGQIADAKKIDDARLAAMDVLKQHQEEAADWNRYGIDIKDQPIIQINNARWGAGDKWTDVTQRVQNEVKDGTLTVVNDGFGNPAYGRSKMLVLDIDWGGVPMQFTIHEATQVGLPAIEMTVKQPR